MVIEWYVTLGNLAISDRFFCRSSPVPVWSDTLLPEVFILISESPLFH